jgi:UDP-2,3-diacylglucosamine pyrophosphatase LpxH
VTDAYYLVSDLHIGGDEQLRHVDFREELIDFLRELEDSDEDAELLINGDAFGLWEFTEIEGPAKLDALAVDYPELFAQLRATGERIPITLIPGNHDYEVAAHDEYVCHTRGAVGRAAKSVEGTSSAVTGGSPAPASGRRGHRAI